jgi:hypothetical protein
VSDPVIYVVLGITVFPVFVVALFVLMAKKTRVRLSELATHLGLTEASPGRCAVRRHDSSTLTEPSRAAVGQRNGVQVELMLCPKLGRTNTKITVVGVVGSIPPDLWVDVHRCGGHLPLFVSWTPFGGPLSTDFRASGRPEHVLGLLTAPLQSEILAFPRELLKLGVGDGVVTLVWKGFETDPALVEQAFRLGLLCVQTALWAVQGGRARP